MRRLTVIAVAVLLLGCRSSEEARLADAKFDPALRQKAPKTSLFLTQKFRDVVVETAIKNFTRQLLRNEAN